MRVLLADSQRLLRDGIRPFLSKLNSKSHVIEATTFDEAILAADEAGELDLAVLGHTMMGMFGVTGIQRFRNKFPKTKVVLLTESSDPTTILAAIAAGADGVISKAMSGRAMQSALRMVAAGDVYLPSDLVISFARLSSRSPPPPHDEPMIFSPAETEVVPLLLDGLSNKVIAQRLGIEEAAIKARLRGIYRKVGAVNRAQAVWSLLSNGKARST